MKAMKLKKAIRPTLAIGIIVLMLIPVVCTPDVVGDESNVSFNPVSNTLSSPVVISNLTPTSTPTPIIQAPPDPKGIGLLLQFLQEDLTNTHNCNDCYYCDNCYRCGHYTEDLCRNATSWFYYRNSTIRLYPVYLNVRTGRDHIIAAAKIDNEWIFIEPQTDGILAKAQLKMAYSRYSIGRYVKHRSCSYGSDVEGVIEGRPL